MAAHDELLDQLKTTRARLVARLRGRQHREWFSQLGGFGDDFFSDE
ncbi:MAG: hypothetical protein ABIR68_09965 [Ilumatobacteraceae bacterium]